MRHAGGYDDYITSRNINLDASFAFLTICWFGSTKDKTRLALHNGCGAS